MVRRCNKCVLPDTVPGVEFDEAGICNHCRGYRGSVTEYDFEGKDEEFKQLLEKQRQRRLRKDLKYDVLAPISGGRDSTYTVWKLVKEYDMKVLCANYKNPFTSSQAQKNIQNLIQKLGIDLVEFPDKYGLHFKSFKTNLRAWLKNPDLASANLMCIACQSIYINLFQIAKKNKIELIVAGANPYEITGFKAESQGVDDLDKKRITKLVSTYSKKVMRDRAYIKFVNIIPAFNAAMSLYGDAPYLRWRYPKITKSAFFYYFPYKEDEIHKVLDSIGWKKAEDNPSPWRFDCEVDSVKNYIYKKLIGATEKDDLFSRYIRAGIMSREEAIERLEKETVNIDIVKRVLGMAGVELSELDEALERANATK